MAAYLAKKVGAPHIKYMRLMKLMYLADRESLARFGEPISYDHMYSLDRGLILSQTYDVVKHLSKINELAPWAHYFAPRDSKKDYYVGVKKTPDRDELDCLSDADIDVLDATAAKFGEMNEWELSQYMHDHCPEWKFPDGSRIPVDDEELLKILGMPQAEASDTALSIKTERQMNRLFRR